MKTNGSQINDNDDANNNNNNIFIWKVCVPSIIVSPLCTLTDINNTLTLGTIMFREYECENSWIYF